MCITEMEIFAKNRTFFAFLLLFPALHRVIYGLSPIHYRSILGTKTCIVVCRDRFLQLRRRFDFIVSSYCADCQSAYY